MADNIYKRNNERKRGKELWKGEKEAGREEKKEARGKKRIRRQNYDVV